MLFRFVGPLVELRHRLVAAAAAPPAASIWANLPTASPARDVVRGDGPRRGAQ
jgi:hypothetical protein